ncbi:MAG: hypothetical protein RQ891_10870 [Thermoflexus sp.]|nr:hypothetical protein [Thermoflexus sp.]MDT7885340.1 hypothetical protein [Thermoflexus sp.]MDT7949532.1 hypothetical protein [Thermoflexus sp.]
MEIAGFERPTRPEPAPVPAARPCAVPGCGAWAEVEIRGLALCRDCVEAFARAYGMIRETKEGSHAGRF